MGTDRAETNQGGGASPTRIPLGSSSVLIRVHPWLKSLKTERPLRGAGAAVFDHSLTTAGRASAGRRRDYFFFFEALAASSSSAAWAAARRATGTR